MTNSISNEHKIFEQYLPRRVSDLGLLETETMQYKVYGITANNKEITEQFTNDALAFAQNGVAPVISAEGDSNGLGFIIIHAGDLGGSILVHWWVQGSVLCQQIKRTTWDSATPMDTTARPVVACVWELELINTEQLIWRQTMMWDKPDPKAYLQTRALETYV